MIEECKKFESKIKEILQLIEANEKETFKKAWYLMKDLKTYKMDNLAFKKDKEFSKGFFDDINRLTKNVIFVLYDLKNKKVNYNNKYLIFTVKDSLKAHLQQIDVMISEWEYDQKFIKAGLKVPVNEEDKNL